MKNPSYCMCRSIHSDEHMLRKMNESLPVELSTCISILPTETLITPDALKYEIFRYVGIVIKKDEKEYKWCSWNYRAVVDSNIYFLLLKFLINRKLRNEEEDYADIAYHINHIAVHSNVRHRDVAFNVLAWIYCSIGIIPFALLFLEYSWQTMNSWDLCFMIFSKEMKQKQYEFNSAKLHALVLLYNVWFARKPVLPVYVCWRGKGTTKKM